MAAFVGVFIVVDDGHDLLSAQQLLAEFVVREAGNDAPCLLADDQRMLAGGDTPGLCLGSGVVPPQ